MGIVAVATAPELTEAIANAQPGDEIVLADGTYTLTGASCNAAGNDAAPITVRAANRRQAKIRFDAVEGFKVNGAYWRFEGLDVTGVCADDNDCEHAFHVMGAAHHFVLRDSAVRDFNAQLKVNAAMVGGTMTAPDDGLIENNEIGDTRGRNTSNPVTKLNIDTGARWIVRGNFLHDGQKVHGDFISYLAFMKSGGTSGVFERNLVACTTTGSMDGVRIGLSFGGGGTGNQFCAPAYDANVPCSTEHTGGTMRNNVIVNCTDVGIYLNEAAQTKVLFNTLINTTGIDARFVTTTGDVIGNLLSDNVQNRNGATIAIGMNRENVAATDFTAWYRAPLEGDLAVVGDVSSLVGAAPQRPEVTDDYCARARPDGMYTFGAVEHSLGECDAGSNPIPGDGGVTPDVPGDDESSSGGCCDAGASNVSSGLLALLVGLMLTGWSGRTRTARTRSAP